MANFGSLTLTSTEQKAIEENWRQSERHSFENSGQRIFKKIFAKNPEIARVFGQDPNQEFCPQLQLTPAMYKHMRVFMNMLELAVTKCSKLPELTGLCHELGQRHASFADEKGFSPDYWDCFEECLIEAALEWDTTIDTPKQREQISSAWSKLVSYIIYQMRVGYEIGKKKQLENGTTGTENKGELQI